MAGTPEGGAQPAVEGAEGGGGDGRAGRWLENVVELSAGLGPTVLVKALPDSNVVTTDL